MTLILKSDAALKLKGKLSERVSGAKLIADFRDGTYVINDVAKALTDIVTVGRVQEGGTYDIFGEYTEVSPNTAKISVDPQSLTKGLLIEQARRNLLLQSKTPATQTISVSMRINYAYVLLVVGSGSATIKRGTEVLGLATEGSPKVLIPSITETVSLTVEVTGDLEYFDFYETRGAREPVSRIGTTTAARSFSYDDVEINPTALQAAIPSFSGCLVVKQFLTDDLFDRTKTNQINGSMVMLGNTDLSKGVFVGRLEPVLVSSGVSHRILFKGLTQTSVDTYRPLTSKNIFAINFSNSGVKIYRNGELMTSSSDTDFELSRIKLGFSNWSTAITQYIEQVAIFDRQLTDNELAIITKL